MKRVSFVLLSGVTLTLTALISQPAMAVVTGKGNLQDVPVSVTPINSEAIYMTRKDREFTSELAFVLTPLPDNKTQIDATAVSYGRGANFRRWSMERPVIIGPDKNVIPALTVEKIEVLRGPQGTLYGPSAAKPFATGLFFALGSQYEQHAGAASDNPGKPCPLSGGSSGYESSGAKSGPIGGAIDRAGMSAGLGLLTSQANGSISGLKVRFVLDKPKVWLLGQQPIGSVAGNNGIPILSDIPFLQYLFRADARNNEEKKLITIVTPMMVKADPY